MNNDKSRIIVPVNDFIRTLSRDVIYKQHGWYPKNKMIIKYLTSINNSENNVSRCFKCYKLIKYDDIEYARIFNLNNDIINPGTNFRTNNNITSYANKNIIENGTICETPGNQNMSCLCRNCCINNLQPKYAPRKYSDIISDYILNDKYELITDDIKIINDARIKLLEKDINYVRFNINEKLVLLNNLHNQNEKLTNNIDLEVEKHKLLTEHHNKNIEICNNIKKQLMQYSIELFRENKNIIDTQINKYVELNNMSKYSVPECRICMMREINVALQCGHTLCIECYNSLLEVHKSSTINGQRNIGDINIDNENDDEEIVKIITCPTCRTVSLTHTQIYL